MTTDKPDTGVRLTDAEAVESVLNSDYMMRQPTERIARVILARLDTARASTAQDEAGEVERLRVVETLVADPGFPVCVDDSKGCTSPGCVFVRRLRAALDDQAKDPE